MGARYSRTRCQPGMRALSAFNSGTPPDANTSAMLSPAIPAASPRVCHASGDATV